MQIDPEQLKQFIEQAVPFNAHLGLHVELLELGKAVIRMPFSKSHVGDVFRPAMHGGALAALIDATAGAAAMTHATANDRLSTIDLRIDYLRPAPLADVLATAEVRRMGKRIAVVNVLVTPVGADDEPVAEGRAVFGVRRGIGQPGGQPSAPDAGG